MSDKTKGMEIDTADVDRKFSMVNPTIRDMQIYLELQKTVNESKRIDNLREKENTKGVTIMRTIYNFLVYIAGSVIAVAVGLGAITAIIWLIAQARHIIWG